MALSPLRETIEICGYPVLIENGFIADFVKTSPRDQRRPLSAPPTSLRKDTVEAAETTEAAVAADASEAAEAAGRIDSERRDWYEMSQHLADQGDQGFRGGFFSTPSVDEDMNDSAVLVWASNSGTEVPAGAALPRMQHTPSHLANEREPESIADGVPPDAAHQKAFQKRPSKKQRDRYRRQGERLTEAVKSNPYAFDTQSLELPESIAKNPALKRRVVSKLSHEAETEKQRLDARSLQCEQAVVVFDATQAVFLG